MSTNQQRLKLFRPPHARLATFWTGLGVLSTLALFPYLLALSPTLLDQITIPLPLYLLMQMLQVGVLLFGCTYVGLRLGRSIGLDSPVIRAWVYGGGISLSTPRAMVAAVGGFVIGLMGLGLDMLWQPFLPTPHQLSLPQVAPWKSLLASFYGGITEELLVRLFLMTLITWLMWKVFARRAGQPAPAIFWGAIIVSAVLFGLAHLPAAALIWPLTTMVILRTVLLNALISLPFGFIFWRWGLEYAMLAHFCTDIALHLIGGS